MATTSPTFIGSTAMVLDREPGSRRWVMIAAQHTTDGRIFVEIGYHRTASSTTIVEHVVDAVTALNPAALVIDARSDAATIEPDLVQAGFDPTMTNTTHYGLACGGFLDDALDGRMTHGGQQVLANAIAVTGKYGLPRGGFIWDAALAGDSIAALRATALARWALLTFASEIRTGPAPKPSYERSLRRTDRRSAPALSTDFNPMTANF